MTTNPRESYEKIRSEQGWNEYTMLELLERHVFRNELTGMAFVRFLEEVAAEENAGSDGPSPEPAAEDRDEDACAACNDRGWLVSYHSDSIPMPHIERCDDCQFRCDAPLDDAMATSVAVADIALALYHLLGGRLDEFLYKAS